MSTIPEGYKSTGFYTRVYREAIERKDALKEQGLKARVITEITPGRGGRTNKGYLVVIKK